VPTGGLVFDAARHFRQPLARVSEHAKHMVVYERDAAGHQARGGVGRKRLGEMVVPAEIDQRRHDDMVARSTDGTKSPSNTKVGTPVSRIRTGSQGRADERIHVNI
jgi:hypothetical protein